MEQCLEGMGKRENVVGSYSEGRKAVRVQNHKSKGQKPNLSPSLLGMDAREEPGKREGTSTLLPGGGSCQGARLSSRK